MASTIFGSSSAAVRAVLHVNVEYAFEQANPADATWPPPGGLGLIFDSRVLPEGITPLQRIHSPGMTRHGTSRAYRNRKMIYISGPMTGFADWKPARAK